MNAFFILTRIDSSRLPAKAMLAFANSTLLIHIANQLKKINGYEPIVLTTDRVIDNVIVRLANKHNLKVFTGNFQDVAMRIIQAIDFFKVENFARINGDSPFLDLELIKKAVKMQELNHYDIISNIIKRTYPYGVAVEVLKASIYIDAYKRFSKPEHFEHPTKYFYENLKQFNFQSLVNNKDYTKIRLTIDTLEDYINALNLIEESRDFTIKNLDEKVKIYNKVVLGKEN